MELLTVYRVFLDDWTIGGYVDMLVRGNSRIILYNCVKSYFANFVL